MTESIGYSIEIEDIEWEDFVLLNYPEMLFNVEASATVLRRVTARATSVPWLQSEPRQWDEVTEFELIKVRVVFVGSSSTDRTELEVKIETIPRALRLELEAELTIRALKRVARLETDSPKAGWTEEWREAHSSHTESFDFED